MIPLRHLIAAELRMGMRTPVFRIAAVLIAALGMSIGSLEGTGAAMSAYATGEAACQYLGILAALWSAYGALRDTAQRVDVLVFTKPQPPERLALARFCGLMGQLACLLAALFLGAMIGRRWVGGSFLGYSAYILQYLRALGVVFFASGAGYCLALLAESAIAGGLVALSLVVALAGRAFLPKHYFPWYSQNLPAFLALGVFFLCLGLWLGRRRLRGARPVSPGIWLTVPAALLVALGLFWREGRIGHDPMVREDPGLARMASQNINVGARVPGFLLPDQRGRSVRLSRYAGKILLVALWSPQEADSALLLATLAQVGRRYGARGVQPVAVCLSEDSSAPMTFAWGEDLPFPVAHDWGTHNAAQNMERSPLALAYRADHLPVLAITDRRHRVRAILSGSLAYSLSDVERYLHAGLEAEPE